MELVLRYLCVIIILQSVSCGEDDDTVLSMLNHISLSLARIARKQRLMDKRMDSFAANMKNNELIGGERENVVSDAKSGEDAKEDLFIMRRAIASEKEFVRNLVESMSINIVGRIAAVEATSDDLGDKIAAIEATSDGLGHKIAAVEAASDDLGDKIAAVEATSDYLGDQIAAVEATSDDLGDKISAVEATSDDLNGRITTFEATSDDLRDKIKLIEKGITVVEATSDGVRTRVDTMETSIATLESAAGRHVSFSVMYKPDTNVAVLKKGTTIKFNRVFYNDGSGYDKTTGIFTVPVSGVYQIIFFVEGWSKTDDFSCEAAFVGLFVDSVAKSSALAEPRHKEQNTQGGNAYTNYLSKGQKVKVSTASNCDEYSIFAFRTTFSGVLLY